MCDASGTCSPCAARNAIRASRLVAIEQAEGSERIVGVWGPASVEVESQDGRIVHIDAVEQAIPQLLRRGVVDLYHRSAFTVGQVQPELRPNAEKAPNTATKRMIESLGGVLKTGVYEVTQAIVDVFPRLKPVKGTRQFFIASRIFGDNDTSRDAQAKALRGELDSYSIAGVATEIAQSEVCTPDGCRVIEHVLKLDLPAVTLCGQEARPGVPKARNPLAGFVVVQMAHDSPALVPSSSAASSPPSPLPHDEEDPMKATPTTKPPVEQAEGEEKPGGEGDSLTPEQMQKALVDQGRRIEQLEQRVAETAGAPTNDAKPEGEAEEEGDEEKEDDPTMKPGEKPNPDKKDEKPVEQAAPAAPFDMDAFVGKLGTVIEQAVTKQLDARGIKPAAVEQAAPAAPAAPAQPAAITRTPQPAAAPATGAQGDTSLETRLIEACESGNPADLKEVWAEVHAQRVAARGA